MDLYYYAYKILEKYPKAERFGLVADIKHSINDTLKGMPYAQKVSANKSLKVAEIGKMLGGWIKSCKKNLE